MTKDLEESVELVGVGELVGKKEVEQGPELVEVVLHHSGQRGQIAVK